MKTVLDLGGALVCFGVFLIFPAAPLAGQDDHDDGHHFHYNHFAVVVGGMTPLSETSETSFALGADYERRVNELWGVGVGVDLTFGDHKRTALIAVAPSYRPVPPLRLSTGPGIELVDTDDGSGGTKTKAYFLWEVGAFYEFHVGPLAVGPNVILDFVGETKTNLTYGVAVGVGF